MLTLMVPYRCVELALQIPSYSAEQLIYPKYMREKYNKIKSTNPRNEIN